MFDKNYHLSTLAEVEQYIKKNGHLPEIPSATEIEKNGVDVGEQLKLQMQKIEELTLYIIEQNKRIAALEKTNKKLYENIKTLIFYNFFNRNYFLQKNRN